MTKKIFFSLLFIGFLGFTSFAQRMAVVDVEKVLESMEEYKTAQVELDKLAETWRQQIAQKYDEIKGLYNKYQSEMVLLSDDAKRQKEDEIVAKEKAVRELQKKRFGPEGSLFKKRQELVQPIQDKVFKTIQTYMESRGFDFILDKNSGGVLAMNPQYDKTADIIKRINK